MYGWRDIMFIELRSLGQTRMNTPRLKLNQPLLPALLVVLVILQLLVPYRGWMILLVTLGGAWFISFLWARALARHLSLVREMRFGWAQVGDSVEERFTLVNTHWLPALWVEIRDHSTLPGYAASRATGVEGNSENRWTIKSTCTQRGVFTLGPTTLYTGDPFGLYSITFDFAATTNMMVMPPVVPLPDIQVAAGKRSGEGRRGAHALEQTVNAAGVRDYTPGDAWARIHWPTCAHRDALFVRQFESTPSSDWWILLDLDPRVQAGFGQDSTLEHAIILAASLADRGLRSGRSVGLVACGHPSASSELIWLPPRGGESRRWEILRALALATPGERPLSELLAQIQPSLRGAASLVVITPAARGDWIQNLLPLRWRGIEPTVLLLDPVSFGGTEDAGSALAVLADLEMARYLITRDVLDRPERHAGKQGQWEWRITPSGRALLARPLTGAGWRVMK